MGEQATGVLSPPIYFNRQSFFYINSALKINAIQAKVKEKLRERSNRLYQECRQCSTNKCLDTVDQKLNRFIKTKQRLNEQLAEFNKDLKSGLTACSDLIFFNDVRVCRAQVQNRYVEKLVMIVNGSGLSKIM